MSNGQEIRDLVIALVENHELLDHAGEICASKRLDVIAYLAHSLGVGSRHAPYLARAIDEYDRQCPCRRPNLDTGARHGAAQTGSLVTRLKELEP